MARIIKVGESFGYKLYDTTRKEYVSGALSSREACEKLAIKLDLIIIEED